MSDKVNILFICNEYPPEQHGGLGIFVKDITTEFANRGHRIFVYGRYNSIVIRQIFISDGITIIKDPFQNRPGFLGRINELYTFGKEVNTICKENNIEIVESFDTGGFFLFINVPKLFVRLHNGERYFKLRDRSTIILEKMAFALKKCHIIAVSHFIKIKFLEYFKVIRKGNKITTIYNGIKISSSEFYQNESNSIVYAGTIKPVKGIVDLLVAYKKSKLFQSNITLDLYGNNTLINGKSYFEYIVNSDLEIKRIYDLGFIKYHGPQDRNHLLEIFRKSLMCIFPSKLESFGLVVIEAMSTGALVIYTDQGAAREIIEDKKEAFLVQPNNIEELTNAIKNLYSLPKEISEEIRKCAKEKARTFGLSRCYEETIKLYERG